ncbi:hypothetical protein JOC37_001301 [Desulfohalotomaculum tongense]|uniref:hypothetical protein n=1 Tax=Desulforadius tongensis TaxID=1216062 RepID=UPI00195E9935|nr:hypothetical protein [Desulforadius tongensis]MBM7854921.1 hypothetical protein [Desulforadius tongensis]
MRAIEFVLRLYKNTKYKACYKENVDRIGRIYLPISFTRQMKIGEEMVLQLAPDKNIFPPGGYTATCVKDKETEKKIRFTEDIGEKGELGVIYISKNILDYIGARDRIAVRIAPPADELGGETVAEN